MKVREIESTYQSYVIDHGLAREGLFAAVADAYRPRQVLYPGCFVHVTPSFYFQHVVYIDKNELAARFFADMDEVRTFVSGQRHYAAPPYLRFLSHDYGSPLPLGSQRYELLISLFAPQAFAACRGWLAPGGILLVNDSFEQSALAAADPDFRVLGRLVPGKKGHILEAREAWVPPPSGGRSQALGSAWLFQKVAGAR